MLCSLADSCRTAVAIMLRLRTPKVQSPRTITDGGLRGGAPDEELGTAPQTRRLNAPEFGRWAVTAKVKSCPTFLVLARLGDRDAAASEAGGANLVEYSHRGLDPYE